MTRSQATIISILAGFVLLTFIGMIVLIFFPYERFLPASPTAPPPPTATPRPTLAQLVLPTPDFTAGSPTATPTNTRVPTATPYPATPKPTVILVLPTPYVRPTHTPTPTPIPPPTATPPPAPTPIPARYYEIYFEADEETITEGDCTELEWRVTGGDSVMLDGRSVSPDSHREVCPDEDTSYELSVQIPVSNRIEKRSVTIEVEPEEDEDEDED